MKLKQEIAQIVDTLPEEVLGELVRYLRQVEKARPSLHLQTILLEDKELLERLAK